MNVGVLQILLVFAAVCLFLFGTWQRPAWVILIGISIASLLDCLEIGTAGVDLGINVYLDDLTCLVLLAAAVVTLYRYQSGPRGEFIPYLALIGLIAVSFARGFGAFGLKPAGNSVRNLLTFIAPTLAIMLLRPVLHLTSTKLAMWFAWAGACLAAIAALRWAGVLPMPVSLEQGEFREIIRSLPSDYAIVVGQALIACLYLCVVQGRRWWWIGATILGGVTLALQHRSVWVAILIGVIWLVLRTGLLANVRWLAIGTTALAALGVIMIATPTLLDSPRGILTTNVNEAERGESTWMWRVQGYEEATDRVLGSDTIDMLIGPPAGWSENTDGSFASKHIHSRYVDSLAYYGFAGVTVLLACFGMLSLSVFRRGAVHTGRNEFVLQQALLLSELIYLVPYFGGILQGAALGLLSISMPEVIYAGASIGRRLVCNSRIAPVPLTRMR